MAEYRTEHDSMGDVQVPAQAYYGAQTQRAVDNFPISGWQLPSQLIHAMGLVKYACGVANRDLGKLTGSGKKTLDDAQVEAMLAAAREVAEGKLDNEFPIDVFQTGSGTSSNMNVNEVISNRAIERLDGDTRRMCGLLMHESIAETARQLGLTRAEARTRIARIRKLLTDAGLEVYMNEETAKNNTDGVSNK